MDQLKEVRSHVGTAIWRGWLAAAEASGAVTHPPIGTPGTKTQGGNSAPAHTPVAALQQSERSGERRGRK